MFQCGAASPATVVCDVCCNPLLSAPTATVYSGQAQSVPSTRCGQPGPAGMYNMGTILYIHREFVLINNLSRKRPDQLLQNHAGSEFGLSHIKLYVHQVVPQFFLFFKVILFYDLWTLMYYIPRNIESI